MIFREKAVSQENYVRAKMKLQDLQSMEAEEERSLRRGGPQVVREKAQNAKVI